MPHIKVRGIEHYYEWIRSESPQLEDLAKPVMVFLHGWAGSGRYWESTARALSDTFDCLLYDLRGFGRSLLPKERVPTAEKLTYEMETYAVDLAEFLDVLSLKQVYLHAHSMGASVAALFLNLYPERVERAILTCTGVFEYDEKSFSQFHQFGGYVVKFRPRWLAKIPLLNRLFMARFLHRSLPDAISRTFLEDFLVADNEAALGTIFTSVSKEAAEVMPQEFAKLSIPTLLVSGEYDKIISAEMGRRAAELSQQVGFVMIPDTAHFPMLEDPAAYLACIRPFLQGSSRATEAQSSY